AECCTTQGNRVNKGSSFHVLDDVGQPGSFQHFPSRPNKVGVLRAVNANGAVAVELAWRRGVDGVHTPEPPLANLNAQRVLLMELKRITRLLGNIDTYHFKPCVYIPLR